MSKARLLELLSPARDADTAIAAINHGADAVYIGADAFGARAAAGNPTEDIRRVVQYAHRFGVKVYVTLNTILYDDELAEAAALIRKLYNAGVDALIVQDMGLLMLDLPPVDLHASTQTDARTIQKIRMLAQAGFSQIVLPREFSIEQIRDAASAADPAMIEVFVHGALCVCYSGDCHAGALLAGRSANRGECPQICRLSFRLTDGNGRDITPPDGGPVERHWLSTADMNRIDYLGALADAGATSFKIEGRLKPVAYVKNVTAAYSKALDELVAASYGRYARASYGKVDVNFVPDPAKSFNRGFTPYFLTPAHTKAVTSWQSPKWTGQKIGCTAGRKGNGLRVKTSCELHNGDGLGYFDEAGRFTGFRVNRVEGDIVYPAPRSKVPSIAGITLYRNNDAAFEAAMSRPDTARRSIGVSFIVRRDRAGRIVLDACDERGCAVTVTTPDTYTDIAHSEQTGQRRNILERLGDTIFRLEGLDDRLSDIFIPSKTLTALRREALDLLERSWNMRYSQRQRKQTDLPHDIFKGVTTTYHDNIANTRAEQFYTSHGAVAAGHAVEISPPNGKTRVMTTRYCLRRSLGACLRGTCADKLPPRIMLKAPIGTLELEFDCENCRMMIYTKMP